MLALILVAAALSPDWSRFRGPNGSGVAEVHNLPVEFGPRRNVLWKTPVPEGNCSPILAGDRLFLTAAEGERLLTLCLDRHTGKLLWKRELPKSRTERKSPPNGPASTTPVTDGENVYSLFSEFGLVSYTAGGKERWRVPLGPFTPPHGMAASPILAGGKLIVVADQISASYIAAFDPA